MPTPADDRAREWLGAKTVIEKLLFELRPDLSNSDLDRVSSALIARLAHHNPPILVCFDRNYNPPEAD